MDMKDYQRRYALEHLKENLTLDYFAEAYLSAERYEKLKRSKKRLILFQTLPWAFLLIAVVLVFIFVPAGETGVGHTNMKFAISLLVVGAFIIFYFIWLLLSQVLVGRLWHKYVKWFRKAKDSEKEIEQLYAIIDDSKETD
jgi:hypothetical protein